MAEGWYMSPNVLVDRWLRVLGPQSFAVVCILLRNRRNGTVETREVSQPEIARLMGVTERYVRTLTKPILENKIARTVRRRGVMVYSLSPDFARSIVGEPYCAAEQKRVINGPLFGGPVPIQDRNRSSGLDRVKNARPEQEFRQDRNNSSARPEQEFRCNKEERLNTETIRALNPSDGDAKKTPTFEDTGTDRTPALVDPELFVTKLRSLYVPRGTGAATVEHAALDALAAEMRERGWSSQDAANYIADRTELAAQILRAHRAPDKWPTLYTFLHDRRYNDDPKTWENTSGKKQTTDLDRINDAFAECERRESQRAAASVKAAAGND